MGGHVKVFDGATGAELLSFFAFDGFDGGVRVAGGALTDDGRQEIITGDGPGQRGHVTVVGLDGLLASLFATGDEDRDGIFVG
jgi:hypothetical protein